MKLFFKSILYMLCMLVLSGTIASAQSTPKTPLSDGLVHEGILSCSGSICHSRQEATGAVVRQNEILGWQDQTSTSGAHLRAYKVLLSERSMAITERLGMALPHKEPACLGCHSDNIPAALRGPKFQADDGISCEACHGSSVNWLTQHYAVNASHANNVELGLYPLEDAQTRAGVCLSCHFGSSNDNQFVTHRMMAAGHPRISFELDLFTELQSHHDIDIDYAKRKKVQTGAHIWVIGQAVALKQQLTLFQNPAVNKDGVFPELVFFDCLACHREISDDPDWRPEVRANPGRPQAPGLVKFNDANMIMLLATALQIAPDIAPQLDAEIKAFHTSLSGGKRSTGKVSESLINLTNSLIATTEKTLFSKDMTLNIIDTVIEDALTRRYTDYVSAEQAIMAVDTLLSSMIAANQIARADVTDMRGEINKGYNAVEDPNAYNQDQLTQALRNLQSSLKGLR